MGQRYGLGGEDIDHLVFTGCHEDEDLFPEAASGILPSREQLHSSLQQGHGLVKAQLPDRLEKQERFGAAGVIKD